MRRGLTLVEVLVVFAILAILIALLLPAVQASRESARRTQCSSQLRQLALAVHQYESVFEILPPSGNESGFGWIATIAPYFGQNDPMQWGTIFDPPVWEANPRPNFPDRIPGLACPSDSSAKLVPHKDGGTTSYSGNTGTGARWFGFNGLFQPLRQFRRRRWAFDGPMGGPLGTGAVSDGLSNTCLISEILVGDGSQHLRRGLWNTNSGYFAPDEYLTFAQVCEAQAFHLTPSGPSGNLWRRGRPWWDGGLGTTLYNHILPPNRPSCYNGTGVPEGAYTVASFHPQGIQSAFGDGRVAFISDSIDPERWRALGSRDGREPGISP